MKSNITLALLVSVLLEACAPSATTRRVMAAVTPETMQIGVTDPNLFSGPIVASRGKLKNGNYRFGQIGGTISFTWRLKALPIQRAQVQPVRIVPTTKAAPTPNPQ